ncbi:nuclear transport factor 2 family protein [Mesorhizobium sp. B2-3-4]|uniref:nuclear transport factor 2 family protein n=1 Tax=Mesorhizobium sp. B2-3-4 TaxID=2589959 RepID=UPI001AED7692|nr:nuclear transport factor 2 family protein [Mesorhizobium sp. B2-3-4]
MAIPDPIRRFVEATNSGNNEAFLDTFTADAFISDWGRSFLGRGEISSWNQSDNIGVQSNLRIVRFEGDHDVCRVRMAVTGNGFNGEGDMMFKLDDGRISQLIIS